MSCRAVCTSLAKQLVLNVYGPVAVSQDVVLVSFIVSSPQLSSAAVAVQLSSTTMLELVGDVSVERTAGPFNSLPRGASRPHLPALGEVLEELRTVYFTGLTAQFVGHGKLARS